jgi:hypothetical protein
VIGDRWGEKEREDRDTVGIRIRREEVILQ